MGRLCAVIPALNEERWIEPVITKVRDQGIDVVVVDDGSTDATADVATRAGASVIRHHTNRGKGAALRTGFAAIIDMGYDAVVTLDADGQHDPSEIPLFIEAQAKTEAAIVTGNRMTTLTGMPPQRVLCNRVGSRLVSQACGCPIHDALIGYRLMRLDALRSLDLRSDGYEIDPEILIRAARVGFSIRHVEVHCIYAGQRSRIRPLRDGARFFRLLRQFSWEGRV